MATCTKCGVKFFVPNPQPDHTAVIWVRTYDEAPDATLGNEIFRSHCRRCNHSQYVEVRYHH